MGEKKPLNPSPRSRRGARSDVSEIGDIRHLWTTATLSQSKLVTPLANVCELSDMECVSIGSKTYTARRAEHDSDLGWEESDYGVDKDSFKPDLDEQTSLKLALDRGSYLGSFRLEGDESTGKSSSGSLSSNLKQKPHQAYWMEQQNRLPLPLLELMESEALEILTKALRSYRSGIGRDHALTQQLQRYIEGLKRHRNRRTHVSAR
ncbi:cation channel sperm-associated auxiliary subunit zeta [Talpa occidentalis]|uniref:cation channel sperm-associated auxiliary subunit zeta n=1 Tax=Talpa occidentalis TaxID=50954 RepID=UPI00188F6F8F|nr:cation channel sperm-associated auxiliary subunit zeta [Talpa occidentalis]